MCVCVCVCLCMRIYIYIYKHPAFASFWACLPTKQKLSHSLSLSIYIYICVCVCVCVCVCLHLHVYIYIYIYIYEHLASASIWACLPTKPKAKCRISEELIAVGKNEIAFLFNKRNPTIANAYKLKKAQWELIEIYQKEHQEYIQSPINKIRNKDSLLRRNLTQYRKKLKAAVYYSHN